MPKPKGGQHCFVRRLFRLLWVGKETTRKRAIMSFCSSHHSNSGSTQPKHCYMSLEHTELYVDKDISSASFWVVELIDFLLFASFFTLWRTFCSSKWFLNLLFHGCSRLFAKMPETTHFPVSGLFAMWLCGSSHQEIELISPSLESGLLLWSALRNKYDSSDNMTVLNWSIKGLACFWFLSWTTEFSWNSLLENDRPHGSETYFPAEPR